MTAALEIRPARRSDAAEMALLMNIAGHGMPSFVWGMLDVDSNAESPIETGRLRAMRDEGSFSWRNTELAKQGDEVVGLLAGYRQPDVMAASEGTNDVHPVFEPLVGLEAKAAGTWYVNALAVYPAWRGHGIGSKLLQRADTHAVQTAARGVSLITADAFPDAVRLYERHGYEIREERPFVPYPGGPDSARWLLMVKE